MNGTEFARISGDYSTAFIGTYVLTKQDIEKNESQFKLYGYFYYGGGTSVGSSSSTFTLDGTTIKSGSYRYYPGYTLLGTKDITVKHNNDGSFPGKNITISATSYHMSGSKSGSIKNIATIPRATASPNLDGNIESDANITLNPAVTTFKHRLYYSYNGKTGYYPSETGFFGATGSLPLDTSFYNYTPESSGTGDLTLYTYDANGNLIGSKTSTITVRCDADKCRPTITATIIDSNSTTVALTGSNAKLVKGYSNAKITYTITPRNGATISSKTINDSTLGTSPFTINKVTTGTFNIKAVDSRGFDTTLPKTNTLINYIPLQINMKAYRTSPTGSEIKINFSGNYFNESFGSVSNTLTLTWKYKEKGASQWINGGTLTDYTISNNKITSNDDISLSTTLFNYQKTYEVALFYQDELINSYTSATVPEGEPVLNWAKNLVNVNGELTINKKSFLELVYPVGAIYISVNSTNPGTLFGFGTWERIQDRFLIGAGAEFEIGETGGSSEVTLGIQNLPPHQHNIQGHNEEGGSTVDWTDRGLEYTISTVGFHTGIRTNYIGGGQPFENLPPYIVVNIWKRVE